MVNAHQFNTNMGKIYSKKETLDFFNDSIHDISNLYKSKCINRRGKTSDIPSEYYTEIISGELLQRLNEFNKIDRITRKSSYIVENHRNYILSNTNRREENFAKQMLGKEVFGLGKIIEYQIPLKDTSKNFGIGKIDLLSYQKQNTTLYIIELKLDNINETLLRAIIEIYTYWLTIDMDKLKNDIIAKCPFYNSLNIDVETFKKCNIQPAVMVVSAFENRHNSFKELKELENDNRPMLKALSNKLGITFFSPDIKYYQTSLHVD
jgi:hypothetical protein